MEKANYSEVEFRKLSKLYSLVKKPEFINNGNRIRQIVNIIAKAHEKNPSDLKKYFENSYYFFRSNNLYTGRSFEKRENHWTSELNHDYVVLGEFARSAHIMLTKKFNSLKKSKLAGLGITLGASPKFLELNHYQFNHARLYGDALELSINKGHSLAESVNYSRSLNKSKNSGNSLYKSVNNNIALAESKNSGNALRKSLNKGCALYVSNNSGDTLQRSKNYDRALLCSKNSGNSLQESENTDFSLSGNNNSENTLQKSYNSGKTLFKSWNSGNSLRESINKDYALLFSENKDKSLQKSVNQDYALGKSVNKNNALLGSSNSGRVLVHSENYNESVKYSEDKFSSLKVPTIRDFCMIILNTKKAY